MNIVIGFESCEVVHIPEEMVLSLNIGDVSDDLAFTPNGGVAYRKTAKEVYLNLSREGNPSYIPRLLRYMDITHITVRGIKYYIHWSGESNGCDNPNQTVMFQGKDNLIIYIGTREDEWE